jgi:hypothetical protein
MKRHVCSYRKLNSESPVCFNAIYVIHSRSFWNYKVDLFLLLYLQYLKGSAYALYDHESYIINPYLSLLIVVLLDSVLYGLLLLKIHFSSKVLHNRCTVCFGNLKKSLISVAVIARLFLPSISKMRSVLKFVGILSLFAISLPKQNYCVL